MLDTLQWSKSNLLVAVQGDSPDTVKEPVSLQMKKASEPGWGGCQEPRAFPTDTQDFRTPQAKHSETETWSFSAHRCQAVELLSKCENRYWHNLSQLPSFIPNRHTQVSTASYLAITDKSLNFQYTQFQWPCFPALCIFFPAFPNN